MPATVDAPRIARGTKTETTSGNDATNIDKTLAQWKKFLAQQPGCDSGFTAAPGKAMRAINVSSAAQVPMILRELHRGDESIRISFPPSTDPKVTKDQVKIRAFLQEHHGKELASLKSELITLLENSHSFEKLQENTKFSTAFDSAATWIDANFTGVESNNSMLTVTDVVSLEGATEKREDTVAAAIVSLEESHKSGRAAVVTVSHADAQDPALRGAIRLKLDETPEIDPSKVRVWIGVEAGAITRERPACEGVRELSLAEFLASSEVPLETTTSPRNDDLILNASSGSDAASTSEENSSTTSVSQKLADGQSQPDSLEGLVIGSSACNFAREATSAVPTTETSPETRSESTTAPTHATGLQVGVAVDNHRTGRPQEDQHLVRPLPAMEPGQAMEHLRLGVTTMDEVTKDNNSGSTFTGVIVTKDGDLVTAHLGDSPASAVIIGKDGGLKKVVALLHEHKPGDSAGRSSSGREYFDDGAYRIIDCGGEEGSIGVAMTHALGNAHFGDVLSHAPELHVHEIQQQLDEGDRLFLLVTSDGAHNQLSGVTHAGHAETIAERLEQSASLEQISRDIATNSAQIRDNVTVILLEVEKGKGAIVAVFDGHGGSDTSEQAQNVLQRLTEQFDQKDQSARFEEVAKRVALEERLKSLRKRLDDAYELRGDFATGKELNMKELAIQERLKAVGKVRELQEQCKSGGDEAKSANLRDQMMAIYDSHNMAAYGSSGDSLDRNVAQFESDWNDHLSDIKRRIEEYDNQTLTPAIAMMRLQIAEIEREICATREPDANEPSTSEGDSNTESITSEPRVTAEETHRRESLEARLGRLRATLNRAEQLEGPWRERLAKFDAPINDASNAIQAANRVIALHQQLYGQASSERSVPDKTERKRKLVAIYQSHEMFRHRARREPGSNRESLVEAVRKFRSHSEGQLQAAQAARDKYIEHQVGTFKMLTTALIALTKREMGSHTSASSDTFTDLSQEQVQGLIKTVKREELREALTRYRDMLREESAQSSGSSFDA